MRESISFNDFKIKRYSLTIVIFILLILLTACEKDNRNRSHSPVRHDEKIIKESIKKKEISLPIRIENGQFYEVSGWVNDQTIIYITESVSSSNLYTYDLYTGVSQLLYESDNQIVSVQISPERNYILIHTALSMDSGQVIVIDHEGSEIFAREVASTELMFSWNPTDEEQILISAFAEDWSYSSYILHIANETFTEILLPQPFTYWIDKENLLYLNWEADELSLFTDVMLYNLQDNRNEIIATNSFHIDTFQNKFMTISVDEEETDYALYTFFSDELESVASFKIPHLSRYSDWVIPYYDYNSERELFITLQPLSYMEVDQYDQGFELVVYDMKKNQERKPFQQLKNMPLACSPNGSYCLYGNYLEQLLNLETGEIISIAE